jgi:16S rRNA (adenine1518-N6/adenine1519-N6)-dimethyltransferase
MVQKEAAQRLCAAEKSREIGAISLAVQYYSVPKMCFSVSPGSFFPPPKVTSSVIRLDVKKDNDIRPENEKNMFRLIRAAFNQRRKTLRNSLKPLIRAKADREGWSEEQLAEFVTDPIYDLRPERLSVEDFISLTLKLA